MDTLPEGVSDRGPATTEPEEDNFTISVRRLSSSASMRRKCCLDFRDAWDFMCAVWRLICTRRTRPSRPVLQMLPLLSVADEPADQLPRLTAEAIKA